MPPTTHTFLFADLAGFAALTEAHGDDQAADLAGEFCDAIRARLDDHAAEHVKSIGDAVLVRVAEAASAVRLGVRIVEEVGGRHEVPVVRVGMHTGSAVEREGDWFGASVNLAARVAAVARGGEVVVTEATRAGAGDFEDIQFIDRGPQRFRHVTEPIRIFAAQGVHSSARLLPIDPVCHMAVEPEWAVTSVHCDRELHFCSERCRSVFAGAPDLYTDVRRG